MVRMSVAVEVIRGPWLKGREAVLLFLKEIDLWCTWTKIMKTGKWQEILPQSKNDSPRIFFHIENGRTQHLSWRGRSHPLSDAKETSTNKERTENAAGGKIENFYLERNKKRRIRQD